MGKIKSIRKIPITIGIDAGLLPVLDRYVYLNNTSRSAFINDLIAEHLHTEREIYEKTLAQDNENKGVKENG